MITNDYPVTVMLMDRNAWKTWFGALKRSKYGSLSVAAEWMYKLNVLARSLGKHVSYEDRHPIVDQIYTLKDELIKYLYQCGYATEVREAFQNRVCRTCSGTGEYYTGEECHRCDGTGIYDTTWLYAFRFCIDGKSYAWHHLQKLVDYPVTVTDEVREPFRKPALSDEYLTEQDAWLGVCCVWWALLVHGTVTDLLLFRTYRWKYAAMVHGVGARWRKLWTRKIKVEDDIPF